MAADGARYRECQAGHAEAVSAFDALTAAWDKLAIKIAGTKGGKNGRK